jgi:hypothetical protein
MRPTRLHRTRWPPEPQPPNEDTCELVAEGTGVEGIVQHYIAGSIPVAIVLDPSVPLAA